MSSNYWHKIVAEVLNKHDPHYPATLTSVKEDLVPLIHDDTSAKIRKTSRNLHTAKRLTQKRVSDNGKVKKYTLGEKFPAIYFTKREAQVAYCFIRGKSTIQTAELLKLSRRTVEFYVNNMKVKLSCRFKSDLISLIIQSDFLKSVDFDHPGEDFTAVF